MATFLVKLKDGTQQTVVADAFTINGGALEFTSLTTTSGTAVAWCAPGEVQFVINTSAFPQPSQLAGSKQLDAGA